MGGPVQSFPVDVLPVAEYESQGWSCTNYEGEWRSSSCYPKFNDGYGRYHTGIDLGKSWPGVPLDAPIYATRAGTVTRIGSPWLGDQSVSIRLDQPEAGACFLIYGHCDRALVKVGDHVTPGQQIALAGTKGSSTAVHLHLRADSTYDYETGPLGTDVDPTPFLNGGDMPLTPEQEHNLFSGEPGTLGFQITDTNNHVRNVLEPKVSQLAADVAALKSASAPASLAALQADVAVIKAAFARIFK